MLFLLSLQKFDFYRFLFIKLSLRLLQCKGILRIECFKSLSKEEKTPCHFGDSIFISKNYCKALLMRSISILNTMDILIRIIAADISYQINFMLIEMSKNLKFVDSLTDVVVK